MFWTPNNCAVRYGRRSIMRYIVYLPRNSSSLPRIIPLFKVRSPSLRSHRMSACFTFVMQVLPNRAGCRRLKNDKWARSSRQEQQGPGAQTGDLSNGRLPRHKRKAHHNPCLESTRATRSKSQGGNTPSFVKRHLILRRFSNRLLLYLRSDEGQFLTWTC